MSINKNITLTRGDTWKFDILIVDENNVPVDITGSVVYFTVKNSTSDPDADAVLQVSVTDPNHTDPTNGKTRIVVQAVDNTVPVGRFYYDFQVDLASGEKITIQKGILTVEDDVTKA